MVVYAVKSSETVTSIDLFGTKTDCGCPAIRSGTEKWRKMEI
jgi:hypothetical protein